MLQQVRAAFMNECIGIGMVFFHFFIFIRLPTGGIKKQYSTEYENRYFKIHTD
jgi:hypothetical protein